MRFFSASILLSITFALGVLTIPVSAETFNTNLTTGSRGTDVTRLQQFLVSKGFLEMPVAVAYGYFGTLTRAAVALWQVANGITPALGYFGPISRQAIATKTETVVTTPPSSDFSTSVENDTPAALGMRANQIVLFRAFPFEARTGDLITLDGSGFSKTANQIYFDESHPVTATSTDGITLKVPVPTTLTNGEYKLSVSNVWGSSDNPDTKVIIRVTSNPQPGPIIESASIVGDTVTLVGSGFASANNLFTTLGDSSSSVSSNGTTLTFRIADLSMYDEVRQFTLGKYQEALWIYVQNEHGVNKEPYKLDIII
ncbi:MAG: peptidoglycan-binding protein [bacterium]|nr:peptidoglycan-binding protein [bacterium]